MSCGPGKECVPHYLCDENDTIITTGDNLLDVRFQADAECKNYLSTCCFIEKKRDKSILPPVIIPKGCGNHQKNGIGFTIKQYDSESQFGEFPWMVAVLKKINVAYQCGGSIIHPKIVLTAAHCLNAKIASDMMVRAGEWDTQTKTEQYPYQDRDVQKFIIHKDYYKGNLANDIALLVLNEPFILGETIQTVCLPPQSVNFEYSRCFASGWGKDVFGKQGKYQVILKKVELPVVPFESCQKSLRTTRVGRSFNLHNSFICAGGEPGKDTCKGDGGSPLVCPISGSTDKYYQAGIVSWGIGCGENQIPGVYVNVGLFKTWTDEEFNKLNLETSYYTF